MKARTLGALAQLAWRTDTTRSGKGQLIKKRFILHQLRRSPSRSRRDLQADSYERGAVSGKSSIYGPFRSIFTRFRSRLFTPFHWSIIGQLAAVMERGSRTPDAADEHPEHQKTAKHIGDQSFRIQAERLRNLITKRRIDPSCAGGRKPRTPWRRSTAPATVAATRAGLNLSIPPRIQ